MAQLRTAVLACALSSSSNALAASGSRTVIGASRRRAHSSASAPSWSIGSLRMLRWKWTLQPRKNALAASVMLASPAASASANAAPCAWATQKSKVTDTSSRCRTPAAVRIVTASPAPASVVLSAHTPSRTRQITPCTAPHSHLWSPP